VIPETIQAEKARGTEQVPRVLFADQSVRGALIIDHRAGDTFSAKASPGMGRLSS
jgi:hypothetical protein